MRRVLEIMLITGVRRPEVLVLRDWSFSVCEWREYYSVYHVTESSWARLLRVLSRYRRGEAIVMSRVRIEETVPWRPGLVTVVRF